MQEDYVTPDIFMKIVNIYAVSFHGSCLWDLFSADCDHLYRAMLLYGWLGMSPTRHIDT